MSSKKNQRDQKRRAKQKKKREAARRVRGSRPSPVAETAPASASVKGAEAWPTGECYLSGNWHEQGARIHAGFVREADDGRRAAAFFEIDLEREGVVEVLARGGVSVGGIQGEMARRSELSGEPMLVVEPDRVVKAVLTGVSLREEAGLQAPERLDAGLGLFGDLDGSTIEDAFLTGTPPPPPPKKRSLFTWLFGE